ncbi:MAG: metalloregulator ArsR/SmtB family transcription factor [bacterium]|nr:metalloregulator ArsR/SmtB family transcription factor [bacterium]
MITMLQMRESLNTEFAKIGKALSSPKRLQIIELLHQCSKSVDTLAENTQMTLANTSQHLQVLRAAGLVESSRSGTFIIYSLSGPLVHELISLVRQVAETHIAEVDRALAKLRDSGTDLENVDRVKLTKLAKSGKVIVLDVRPHDEYQAAHVPYAISVPLEKLEDYLDRLPRDQQIVAYCRGPYCLLAGEAIRILKKHGLHASQLREGVSEWQRQGQAVVTGDDPAPAEGMDHRSS